LLRFFVNLSTRCFLALFTEGVGPVHSSFLAEGLVAKVQAYVAPKLIGGKDAPGAVGGQGVEHLADALQLRDLDMARLGDDILITAYVDVHRDS
jgi:diaminohydroxyphosphoribosylaminopyrimidine deaminase/5-amino-6-(5-phosphoribosylamino)uracil reductase